MYTGMYLYLYADVCFHGMMNSGLEVCQLIKREAGKEIEECGWRKGGSKDWDSGPKQRQGWSVGKKKVEKEQSSCGRRQKMAEGLERGTW